MKIWFLITLLLTALDLATAHSLPQLRLRRRRGRTCSHHRLAWAYFTTAASQTLCSTHRRGGCLFGNRLFRRLDAHHSSRECGDRQLDDYPNHSAERGPVENAPGIFACCALRGLTMFTAALVTLSHAPSSRTAWRVDDFRLHSALKLVDAPLRAVARRPRAVEVTTPKTTIV